MMLSPDLAAYGFDLTPRYLELVVTDSSKDEDCRSIAMIMIYRA